MATSLCQQFDTLRKIFRDELDGSGKYDFENGKFKKYCPKEKCDADTDIVNAGCLWLFSTFFDKYGVLHYEDIYKDMVVCIMIWLSYKLSLKSYDGINTLNDFYSNYIENNEKYTQERNIDSDYDSYKEIIDEIKDYMNINISHMSKFYELLKFLCNMNTAYTKDKSNDFSKYVKNFVDEYEKLLNDNIKDSSYSKVLLVLSNYYNNFVNNRAIHNTQMKLLPLPTQKTAKNVGAEGSNKTKLDSPSIKTNQSDTVTTTPSSNTTLSGSSLVNKLIPFLSIIVGIAILLGISYKVNNKGLKKTNYYIYANVKKQPYAS
ncbi:putative bir1 protein [Plasmodium yoelii yoelii]|uniref:Bir1 protein n=1 Tax=Plasmodium yoelii yoelii TaxID=73239 RepID=Q7RT43_PLAYO|nr:putative bir1 protein [Plasmodium yoelii yoelii]